MFSCLFINFQVITTKFPALGPVAEKLLDIYFMLSAGKHDTGTEGGVAEASTHGKFLSTGGRLISTRYSLCALKLSPTFVNVSFSYAKM